MWNFESESMLTEIKRQLMEAEMTNTKYEERKTREIRIPNFKLGISISRCFEGRRGFLLLQPCSCCSCLFRRRSVKVAVSIAGLLCTTGTRCAPCSGTGA